MRSNDCSEQIDFLRPETRTIVFLLVSLGNASLISEALRHYQRLENESTRERAIEKSGGKQHRRPYHIKESRIRPVIVQQAVTQKIKVCS